MFMVLCGSLCLIVSHAHGPVQPLTLTRHGAVGAQGNRNRYEMSSFIALPPDEPKAKVVPRPNVAVVMLEYIESMMSTIE